MTYVFLVALLLIFIGELGDKSQLLALVLATKYKPLVVIIGIFCATLTIHILTTLLGQWIGGAIPSGVMPWITGVLFIGFGLWTLRRDKVDEGDAEKGKGARYGAFAAVFIAFFIAELGDKTQLMTLAIAADPTGALGHYLVAVPSVASWFSSLGLAAGELTRAQSFWAVSLGSTVGMVLADALAIIVGRVLGKRLPEKLLTRISGIVFIAFGVLSIGSTLL